MIKSSIDSCNKKKPVKTKLQQMAKLLSNKRQKPTPKTQSLIDIDIESPTLPLQPRKKSFYEVYKEEVARKSLDRKNKNSLLTPTRMPSINQIKHSNRLKLKSFEFEEHLPDKMEKDKSKDKDENIEESVRKRCKKRENTSKVFTPKSVSDWVSGTKKEFSLRYESRFESKEKEANTQSAENTKCRKPNLRPTMTESPYLRKEKLKSTMLDRIDPWVTQDY